MIIRIPISKFFHTEMVNKCFFRKMRKIDRYKQGGTHKASNSSALFATKQKRVSVSRSLVALQAMRIQFSFPVRPLDYEKHLPLFVTCKGKCPCCLVEARRNI